MNPVVSTAPDHGIASERVALGRVVVDIVAVSEERRVPAIATLNGIVPVIAKKPVIVAAAENLVRAKPADDRVLTVVAAQQVI